MRTQLRSTLIVASFASTLGLHAHAFAAPPDSSSSNEPRPGAGTTGTSTGRGTSTGGVSSGATGGGFSPPSGATFDPNTSGDAGMVNGNVNRPSDASAAGGGFDIVDTSGIDDPSAGFSSSVPEFHIVQPGDTLWDICVYYFGDPYMWPRIWSFNEQITNAHWIFPGDRVRLMEEGRRAVDTRDALDYTATKRKKGLGDETYTIERYAFVSEEEYEESMRIMGGAEAKVMLARSEMAYVSYDEDAPPITGERLAVYTPKQRVYDIVYKGKKRKRATRGKALGYVVEITGEVQIGTIAEKSAEAMIVDSISPVERGQRVGELQTRFAKITPVPAESTEVGAVVEILRNHDVSGESQFVIVNMGAERGVKRGNILDVVHRGDEYSKRHDFTTPYEEGHPRRITAAILVVQVDSGSALGVVIDSRIELYRGDRVELIQDDERFGEPMPPRPEPRSNVAASGGANGSAKDSKAEGNAGFKLGGN